MRQMCKNWADLGLLIEDCRKCDLYKGRRNIVLGEGNIRAKLMFIGESPGGDEDRLGKPFVGKAGKLLDKIFEEIGLKREEIYITNIVKCRPPQNRDPKDDEADACKDYLRNQVILIKPKVIVLLGSVALKNILGKEFSITKARGQRVEMRGIGYIPTWHPAAVLRDESKKTALAEDLKLAAALAKL